MVEALVEEQLPQRPRVSVERILFSGGEEFTFEPNEKIIVVGPNNSGKSELLREINLILSWQPGQIRFGSNKVVKQLKVRKEGTHEDLMAFLLAHGEENQAHHIDYQNQRVNFQHVPCFQHDFLGPLAPLYCKNLGAEGRLAITAVQKGAGADGHRAKPQQVMYDSDELTE